MTTVDNLLITIVNSFPEIEEQISLGDSKVLRSLATAVTGHQFITENQSKLLVRILKENSAKLKEFTSDINAALNELKWSREFRKISEVKKFYIDKNLDQESVLVVEFTFSSELRKIVANLSKKLDNLIISANGKINTADLTENNLVTLYETLKPLGFEIDDLIETHYATIKSWNEAEIKNQFLLTTITNTDFHKIIAADLGIQTAIDRHIINDRSVRYQYFTDRADLQENSLVEIIANRTRSKIWINKNKHTVEDVFDTLIHLKRFPVLIVFDTFVNSKHLENLKMLAEALEKNGIGEGVGVYFRLPNDESGKKFNTMIAEKKYNYRLDENLKVAVVISGKIPKFFLKNPWQPMAVIALDTKMGLRHGKTSVYTNCCDLIIEYAEEQSMLEGRKIL
jgi:hypothetical protein